MRRVIVVEGAANVVVLTAKAYVGVATGSLTVLGDAIHSLTDLANNVVAWFVVHLAGQAPDRKHPYGHRKFEVLAVFALATLLMILAFELVQAALGRDAKPVESDPLSLGLMGGVLLVNIGIAAWQHMWARRLESLILGADARHTLADVLTTLVVIGGWQLASRGFPWLDSVCALLVAGYIGYLAFGLFQRVVPVLVDEVAIEPETLISRVTATPGVRDVRRVRSRWIGSARAVDMVVGVDPALPTVESHRIADVIEQMLERDFDVADVSIHIEPEAE